MSEELNGLNLALKNAWDMIFSILRSSRHGQPQDCHTVSELPAADRYDSIRNKWGLPAAVKCGPILHKIVSIEEEIERRKPAE